MAQTLATLFPPLGRYCPALQTISAPQAFFLLLKEREAFYGGAAGGGKSAALLMAALQFVDVPGYSALLLRRTFPELEGADGLISQAHSWLANTDAVWSEQKHRWSFPSGATLQFGHVQDEGDKTRYQGQAYQFVGFDELTHFSETQYDYVAFTRSRRNLQLRERGVPIRARAASNPGGVGHAWVKARFIDNRKRGVVFVPAKVADNPGLDVAEYTESLSQLPEELRRQLLDGDWGAFEGAAFRVTEDHVVKPFLPPKQWQRFESMDHGISNPTAWLVHAVDYEGNIVTFDSHYEAALPSETAQTILKRRMLWRSQTCFGDPASLATRTGTKRWGRSVTLEDEYAHHGLNVAPAKSDPRAGYARLRELLKLDPEHRFPDWHPRRGERGSPRWFIAAKTCPQLLEQLRSAPLAPIEHRYAGEMIDSRWEGAYGHAVAAARYGMVSWPSASVEPETPPEDPNWSEEQRLRAQWMWEHERKRDGKNKERASNYSFL